jgi:hypothetical protein
VEWRIVVRGFSARGSHAFPSCTRAAFWYAKALRSGAKLGSRSACAVMRDGRVTNRDLRRTWKTLAGKAGVPKEIRDRIQNHALKSARAWRSGIHSSLPCSAKSGLKLLHSCGRRASLLARPCPLQSIIGGDDSIYYFPTGSVALAVLRKCSASWTRRSSTEPPRGFFAARSRIRLTE